MSIAINGLLLGITLLLGLIPLLLTARLKRRLPELARQNAIGGDCPPATAILPCKGLDPGFRENVLSLMAQDYPDLELLFVVATADDPAYGALRALLDELLAEHPALPDEAAGRRDQPEPCPEAHQPAGRDSSRCRPTSRVLVFVDSDCRPDPGFIRRLVAPSRTITAVGATTGYRWYHPPDAQPGLAPAQYLERGRPAVSHRPQAGFRLGRRNGDPPRHLRAGRESPRRGTAVSPTT
jgi:cellulose synthase/poly-beta-1,6-N-acetylglucosamine synthase-like glycosyltransferase